MDPIRVRINVPNQQCFFGLEKYSIACQLLFLHLNNIVVKHTCKKETVDGDNLHSGYRIELMDKIYDLVIVKYIQII